MEKITDFDRGSVPERSRLAADFSPASTVMLHACGSLGVARGDGQTRCSANRRQRLATKTKRADRQQIVTIKFGCRMPLYCEFKIRADHPLAVVA